VGNRQPDLAERFLEIIEDFVPFVGYSTQELMKIGKGGHLWKLIPGLKQIILHSLKKLFTTLIFGAVNKNKFRSRRMRRKNIPLDHCNFDIF